MSKELYYLDENGKKSDAALHGELLREYDPAFELDMMAVTLRRFRNKGDSVKFDMFKEQYDELRGKYALAGHEDLI